MNDSVPASALKRQRLILLAMILVFAAPVVLSWIAFKFTDLGRDQENPGHGILIEPPRQLPDSTLDDPRGQLQGQTLHGKWSLVYLLDGDCRSTCEENMYTMRQLRLALGDDASRVQRVLYVMNANNDVLSPAQLQEYGGQLLLSGDQTLLQNFLMSEENPTSQNRLYLVDPRGFLFMGYPADTEPKGIIKDLKRLLRYSRIG